MARRILQTACTCRTIPAGLLHRNTPAVLQVYRGFRHNRSRQLIDLYKRRLEQGPEPERPRSAWVNWNYESEVYAFGKRLGENFKETTLKQAFTQRSYIEKEQEQRKALSGGDDSYGLNIEDNEELVAEGEKLTSEYIKAYLRHHLPLFPEEGISAVSEYLMSTDSLSDIGSKLGIKDLILCAEFPVSPSSIARTFLAVVGGLARDQGTERSQLFVQDFVLTQLIGKDIHELWDMHNPMSILAGVLQKQGLGPPEPRLLWQSGCETIVGVYMVGIYSDKQLIGKAPGETVNIAEEMAARDALRQSFGTTINRPPFKYGQEGHQLKLDMNKTNTSVLEYENVHHLQ